MYSNSFDNSLDNASFAPPELVEQLYASALEPGRYDELMLMWQRHVESSIDRILAEEDEERRSPAPRLHSDELERHFLRAFSILERLGRPVDDKQSIEALIEVNPQPSMLVAPDGRIVAANPAARDQFAIGDRASVDDLYVDPDGVSNLKNALATMEMEESSRLLAVVRVASPNRDDEGVMLALSRAQRPEGMPPMGVLAIADIAWSARVGQVLSQAFGLTETECDIAGALARGLSAKRIAVSRKRSVATVRTQIKAVMRKVDVRSQSELIRLTAALLQVDLRGEAGKSSEPSLSDPHVIVRPGPRRMEYVVIGPQCGRPVLFLHGMLDGHGVTSYCRAMLEERKIRLVAPVRPHFGRSEPDGGPEGAPDRLAADIESLLDALQIDSCPVIGHMAGSVYSFAAAYHLPQRISSLLIVSGGVPILSRRQFAMMTPRQRVVAYTARYTPTLLPVIVRTGIALLDSGGDHAFMRALYESAPVDYRVARQPEVFDILSRGYRFTTAQGHSAFETDSRQVTANWSRYVDGSKQNVVLVHGRHDPVVRISTVREFVARYANRMRLVTIEDEGQLVFYARPDAVLEALDTLQETEKR